MDVLRASIIGLCISLATLTGCAAGPEPAELAEHARPRNDRDEPPGPLVAAESPAAAAPVRADPADGEQKPDAPVASPAADADVAHAEADPIDVPEDLYQRSFDEVSEKIKVLNQIMDRRDYETWTTHLTDRFEEYYRHPDVLAELSRQPFLAHNNITLGSLRDYFEKVVAPSRARARLDGLVFYSDSLVEAVTEYRGQPVILYLLRNVDGEWKIDTREKPPTEA